MTAEPELRAAFHQHKDAVYRFAWRMTRSPALAEDITQEVFLSLTRRPAECKRTRDQLRAFLLGIARNLAFKHWRNDKRWKSLEDDQFVAAPLNLEEFGVTAAVASAIGALAPLQREALILAEYEGLSLQEIAEITDTEPGTIKARLHRARENLKRMLAPFRNTRNSREYGTAK